MSDKPAEGTVTPPSATSGVTEEQLQQMIQKVVMGITKEAIPRMVQKSIEASIPALLEKMAEDATKEDPAATPDASNSAGIGKDTMKALRAELDQLKHGIQERDRKLQEADQRTRDIRLRSEVQSHFARHLGADSPHLAPYVNHFMAQFADHEGQAMRKSKNDYGEEVFVPAAQAIDEMFKGDLKHLVQSSKASQLPNVGGARQFGQPVKTGNGQQNQQVVRNNPLMQVAQELAETRPEAAQILADDALKIGVHVPVNK